jgi:hypothetical protein
MKNWKKRGSVPSSRDALLLWGEPKMRVKDQLQKRPVAGAVAMETRGAVDGSPLRRRC